MKIKIFTEGGLNIGLGHLSRCSSLYDKVNKKKYDLDFYVFGKANDIGLLENREVIYVNWLNDEFLSDNISSDDYCIVDSYLASKEILEIISRRAKKVLFIDDMNRLNYPEGLVVNPSLDVEHLGYDKSQLSKYNWGPSYIILRSPFDGISREIIRNSVEKVLITMGGVDYRGLTPVIINEICNRYKEIAFDVVITREFSNINAIRMFSGSNVSIHSDINANEMKNLMLDSDFAITAAGQTIYELIATKTPSIAIQVVENQINNISAIKKRIPSQLVLTYDDKLLLKKLHESFRIIREFAYREKNIQEMNGIIDGKGSERIISKLLDNENDRKLLFLRKADKTDLRDAFELSNKDYVRKHSINKKKILWEEHIEWFNNVLHSNKYVFFVVTDERNSFLGQIRFQIEDDNATVSISLSEKLKGTGRSKELLSQGIEELFKENKEIKQIIAFVSEKNLPSMKIFRGLNFSIENTQKGLFKFILRRIDYAN